MNEPVTIGLPGAEVGNMPACEFAALMPMLDKSISHDRLKQARLVLVEGWTSERVSRMFDVTPQAVRKSVARVKLQYDEWLASLATLALCRGHSEGDATGLAISIQIPDKALSLAARDYVKDVARVWQLKPEEGAG